MMLRKHSQVVFLLASMLPLGGFARASTEGLGVKLAAMSAAGREISLSFAEDSLSTAVKTAVVCALPPASLSTAKLWMPDMGHGTSPTSLTPESAGCTRVERMNFLMGGLWELRVSFADGDSGVFTFDVSE